MAARASLILALLHSLLSLAAAQQTGACPAGRFGGACQHTCHCSNPASCDPGTGSCDVSGCQSDYEGPFCQKYNVARQGTVTAVGGWSSPTLATDGSPGDSTFATCFHSAEGAEFYPGWWRVDLGAVFPMDDIRIWFWAVTDLDRSSGLAINILNNTDVKTNCRIVTGRSLRHQNFTCPQWGQILELRKETNAARQTVALCEVQVFACVDKTYGSTCTPCGQCQGGTACDRTDGTCPAGCDPGWSGSWCVTAAPICPANTYGPPCTPCGHCQGGAACASTDGSCPADCEPGWTGQRCDTPCSINCLQGTCAQQTGFCTGCQAGWWGGTCNATCSSNCLQGTCAQQTGFCTGCQDGWWGVTCNARCSSNCLQGTCAQQTGFCTGCKPGWRGDTCNTRCENGKYGADCSSTCGECASPPCHHVNGTCFGGCQPGKTGELCKDDCPAGFYGVGCTSRCGKCQDSSCLADGRCPGLCQPGWRGGTCNETCRAGQFGLKCSNTCGSCRDNAVCDHVTGNCPAGCQAGWEEPRCLQERRVGTDREGCTQQCVCQSMSYNQGMGAGIGIGIGVSCLLLVPALIGTVLFFRRRLRSQRPTQSTDPTVYYNTAQTQAESEDKGPYASLEAATRNANVPSDYEEIRGNRRR